MEAMGGVLEREWISLSRTYSAEESEIMACLLNNFPFPSELSAGFGMEFPADYWHGNESSYHSSETSDSNAYGFPNPANENYSFSDSHPLLLPTAVSLSMEFCMEDMGNACFPHIHEDDGLNMKVKKKTEELTTEDKSFTMENSKKRSLNSPEAEKTKGVRGRKRQKLASNEEEHMVIGQCTSSFGYEDDCNESQEVNGRVCSSSSSKGCATLNSNGKPRASRGSATDPQSLYARKRRERINERLKILQNLVPNGTKVHISTMLEEAVQYVKFLQLQIKLLSSDDLWMYAPIAYNGIDIGLNLKLMKEDDKSQLKEKRSHCNIQPSK